MIINFKSAVAQDIYDGSNTKSARRIPQEIWGVARRKLDILQNAVTLADLKAPPANRLGALKGDLKGKHSIRINDQFRIIFEFHDSNAHDVDIVDYH